MPAAKRKGKKKSRKDYGKVGSVERISSNVRKPLIQVKLAACASVLFKQNTEKKKGKKSRLIYNNRKSNGCCFSMYTGKCICTGIK